MKQPKFKIGDCVVYELPTQGVRLGLIRDGYFDGKEWQYLIGTSQYSRWYSESELLVTNPITL